MPSRFSLSLAAQIVRAGGIVAHPTEAVFGLGCLPEDGDALQRLISIKQRSAAAGLILIADSIERANEFIKPLDQKTMKNVYASWPGPTTWILPAANVHPLVTGARDTVAVRVTDHPVCQALCRMTGSALVSTSANLSGQRPALNVLQIRRKLGGLLDGIVNGPLGDRSRPSTIIDARTGVTLRS